MRRRAFNALFAIAFTTPRLVLAEERREARAHRLHGLAPAAGYAPRVDALRAGLHDLGYIEGRNLSFEFRWAETPQQMPKLAAELVSAEVDVIFTPTSMETGAALETTKTVPVIFGAHADPVGVGHVASLSRPGGNATGMTMLLTDLVAKELEALKEALLETRVGSAYCSPLVRPLTSPRYRRRKGLLDGLTSSCVMPRCEMRTNCAMPFRSWHRMASTASWYSPLH